MKIPASIICIFLLFLSFSRAEAQVAYTPYDELAGIDKNYKPICQENFPSWAKELYEYPVNAKEIEKDFDLYMNAHAGKKSPIIRYYKLWRRAVAPYVNDRGEIVLPDIAAERKALYERQLATGAVSNKKSTSASSWTFLGPKDTYWLNESNSAAAPGACPWQVNIYSFDVSRSNPDVIYCGTETGILNKTTDKGASWEQLGLSYPFGGGVTAVLVHPQNPDVVIAAAGNQLHRTTDGGLNWSPILPANSLFHANRLKVNPDDPNHIAAASDRGIFISTDGGDNWVRRTTYRTWDVDFNPANSDVLYGLFTNASGNFQISLSTDGGLSFTTNSFPVDIPDASGGLLAVTPANVDLLMCVMLSSDNEDTPYIYRGVYNELSKDLAWELTATGKTSKLGMNNGQGYFDLVLELSPINEYLMFVGTTTLFKTVNGGISFSAIGGYYGPFAIHPDIQDMLLLENGDTWVATDGGMNYSTDYFTSVDNYSSKTNGVVGSDMWGFDMGWNEDIIVGGRYHNGNTALADFYGNKALRMGGAESPTGWVIHGKSRHVAFDDLGDGWVLPKTAEGPPEGRFFFSKYPNMEEFGGRRGNLLHHPNYSEILYLGEGTGFWKSTDMGQTFDLLHSFPDQVRYMEISFRDPDVLFADVLGSGLYRSDDGGLSWEHKPSLTSGSHGSSYWNGKLFFAHSPANENVIYACLSNGAWSQDIGKVFKSTDGGDSWTDLTGSVSEYLKSIVIQPDETGQDLLYLFTISKGGSASNVYYRDRSMSDWADYGQGYPSGMNVNRAMPFFRDAKLRVGGSASIWESPMVVEDFYPFVIPWVGRPHYDCCMDTIQFDDHSILNHEGASWEWEISPEPAYISDALSRNPRVVLGEPGSYTVTLKVTRNGQTRVKRINDMVSASTCPSLFDCSNPTALPKTGWEVIYVDSEELPWQRYAENVFDGDEESFWHTAWSQSSPTHPHEIQIDLDSTYLLHDITLFQRSGSENGRIDAYELYITDTLTDWGSPVSSGNLENSAAPQRIEFTESVVGSYLKLIALSEVNGNAWTSLAEIDLTGCYLVDTTSVSVPEELQQALHAYPVPTSDRVRISLPGRGNYSYRVIQMDGRVCSEGQSEPMADELQLDLGSYPQGAYLVMLLNEAGTLFRVNVVKQ